MLIALLGAGIGAAVTLGGMQLYRYTHPDGTLPIIWVAAVYIGTSLIAGLLFFLLSNRIIHLCGEVVSEIIGRFDRMPAGQLLTSVIGLILGLVIAMLLSGVLNFIGESIFAVSLSAIMFVIFGLLGYTIGWRRHTDFVRFFMHLNGFKGHRFTRKRGSKKARRASSGAVPAKLLDTSALIDGRIFDVCRLGFVEGELVAPEFVLTELRHIADSTEAQRRARGRRGLEMLQKMQAELKQPIRIDATNYVDTDEADVKLLRLAKTTGAVIVTGDYNLNKVAAVTGVKVLNLNELAGALRPVVRAGDELMVDVVKEGKEPGQGVAYMEDGTMIVVDGGRALVGEAVAVTVTSVLQTSAGRMIFAKVR